MSYRKQSYEQSYERIAGVGFIGREGIKKLQSRKVLIYGVGNIGGQASYHLGLLGINLTLVDCGIVETENLVTQGYEVRDIGTPKVCALERRLKGINPDCTVVPIQSDIRKMGMAAFKEMDILLCCLDSLSDRLWVNEMAYRMGIQWIDAAIDGSGNYLFGRVVVYNPESDNNSPCYLCGWDARSLHAAIRRELVDKGKRGCPDWRRIAERGETPPSLSISSLGGVIGSLQSRVAIDLLLCRSDGDMAGREICVDLTGMPFSMKEYKLKRNNNCLFDHRVYSDLSRIEGDLDNLTIEQIFNIAEDKLGGDVLLRLHGRDLIGELICPKCRASKILWKMAGSIEKADMNCQCGGEMRASPRRIFTHFTKETAKPFLHKTCPEIGLPNRDVITASNSDKEIHFIVAEDLSDG